MTREAARRAPSRRRRPAGLRRALRRGAPRPRRDRRPRAYGSASTTRCTCTSMKPARLVAGLRHQQRALGVVEQAQPRADLRGRGRVAELAAETGERLGVGRRTPSGCARERAHARKSTRGRRAPPAGRPGASGQPGCVTPRGAAPAAASAGVRAGSGSGCAGRGPRRAPRPARPCRTAGRRSSRWGPRRSRSSSKTSPHSRQTMCSSIMAPPSYTTRLSADALETTRRA